MSVLVVWLAAGVSARAQEWTWLNPKPSGRTAVDVAFLDAQTGFLLNEQELYQTRDGGETWVWKGAYGGRQLQVRNNVVAIAAQAGIYLSNDRGESWSFVEVDGAKDEDFHSLQLVGDDSIYVVGAERLYKSFDGGAHWTSQPILITALQGGLPITQAVFTSSRVGHVAGSFGLVAKTVDGGATWYVTQPYYQDDQFIALIFVNERVGYASSQHSILLQTTDGGETWATVYNAGSNVRAVFFVSAAVGYMTGNKNSVLKTVDGGAHWESRRYPTNPYGRTDLYDIHFFNEDKGLIVGDRGIIIRTVDGGVHWTPYAATHRPLNDICFSSNATGYIFTDQIFKTTNRGDTWSLLTEGLEGYTNFTGGNFVSDNLGFVSANGSLLRTTDGGAHWTPTGLQADGVSFVSATIGFAYANTQTLQKTVDGGASWSSIPSTVGRVYFVSETKGVRLADGIYQTTDGGATWVLRQAGATPFTDVYFVDANVGYVTGEEGKAYKTMDGGNSWKAVIMPENVDYTSVAFLTRNIGVITSSSGYSFMTYDGGNTWEDIGIAWGLNAAAVTAEGRVYVAGTGGAVLMHTLTYEDVALKVLPATNTKATSASVGVVASANRKALSGLLLEYGRGNDFDLAIDLSPATIDVGDNHDYTIELTSLLPSTTYRYRVRAVANGSETVISDTLSFTTAQEPGTVTHVDETTDDRVRIYPNPAHEFVTIECTGEMEQIEVFDLLGRRQFIVTPGAARYVLPMGSFLSGVYVVRIQRRGKAIVRKIVRE